MHHREFGDTKGFEKVKDKEVRGGGGLPTDINPPQCSGILTITRDCDLREIHPRRKIKPEREGERYKVSEEVRL